MVVGIILGIIIGGGIIYFLVVKEVINFFKK